MKYLSNISDNKDLVNKNYVDSRTLNDISPIATKEYSGIYGSANDQAGASFYFAGVRPTTFYDVWRVRYRVFAYVPSQNNYKQFCDVEVYGSQNGISYWTFNRSYSTDYQTFYYHNVCRLKSAGYTSGYKHILGVGLRSATNPTSSSYPRTFNIQILETQNCDVTFYDTMKKIDNISEYSTTNYEVISELDARNNGLRETGDDNTIHQLRHNNGTYKAGTALYRYQICFSKDELTLLPVNAVNNSTATTKTLTTTAFNPFGQILYYNSTTTVSSGSAITATTLMQQINVDLRYSFNTGTTLTNNKDVFIVCTPQSNGLVKLASSPISQTLPTSADGYVYIYLGHASSSYQVEIHSEHPVYEYKDGALRMYTNAYAVSCNKATNDKNGDDITTTYVKNPTSLYSNTTGTTGDITLSSTVGAFTYLEIYYYSGDMYGSVKMDLTKQKANITISHDYSASGIMQVLSQDLAINTAGTKITRGTERYVNLVYTGGNTISGGTQTSIYIYKVLGWKY